MQLIPCGCDCFGSRCCVIAKQRECEWDSEEWRTGLFLPSFLLPFPGSWRVHCCLFCCRVYTVVLYAVSVLYSLLGWLEPWLKCLNHSFPHIWSRLSSRSNKSSIRPTPISWSNAFRARLFFVFIFSDSLLEDNPPWLIVWADKISKRRLLLSPDLHRPLMEPYERIVQA